MIALYDWEIEIKGVDGKIHVRAESENQAVEKARSIAGEFVNTKDLRTDDYKVCCLKVVEQPQMKNEYRRYRDT